MVPQIVGKCRGAIKERVLEEDETAPTELRRLGGKSALQNEVAVRGDVVVSKLKQGRN